MNAAENLFTGFEDLGDDFATVEINNEAPKTLEDVSMGARPNSRKDYAVRPRASGKKIADHVRGGTFGGHSIDNSRRVSLKNPHSRTKQ